MATSYDAVEYPTMPRILGHPGHLNAVARMFGVAAPPVERCRVLEIGCGDGTHLASCAVTMPDATFVGFDLAAEAIARGQRLVERVGLKNIVLEVGDITTWQPDAPFDYILVHGIYSWIPDFVREALMALVARSLAPTGIACVSYNCYPAGYTRRMLWEMMKYHIGDRTDPEEMIEKALELARFIQFCRPKQTGVELELFDNDVDIVINKQFRNVLFHDELAPTNHQVHFHEFADDARRHGLRFVSELEPHVMANADLPKEIDDLLRTLSRVNPERREQYFDFACLRRFRQTLVTREPHVPRGVPDPAALRGLYLTGNCGTDAIDFHSDKPMVFAAGATTIDVRGPLAKAAMVVLVETRPRRLTFDEVLAGAAAKIGRASIPEDEAAELAADLVVAWTSGLVLLKGFSPKYATEISERPVASPFARDQLRRDPTVMSLLHLSLRFDDEPGRRLVELLDGTRTLDQLVCELRALMPPDKRPDDAELRIGLTKNLRMLALSGLLIA
jgi:SAM-dependent methyltransferase